MHHPKHIYLTGIITGAIMGIIMSFFSYSILVYVIGDLHFDPTKLALSLEIMIACNIFIGALLGTIVALIVHGICKH